MTSGLARRPSDTPPTGKPADGEGPTTIGMIGYSSSGRPGQELVGQSDVGVLEDGTFVHMVGEPVRQRSALRRLVSLRERTP